MDPQRILVNERSVVGQARDEYEAGTILGGLAEILRAITRHLDSTGRKQAFATSQTLSVLPLIKAPTEVSFLDCLFKRRGPDQQSVRGLIQKLLTNGPYSEELLAAYNGHYCERHRDDGVVNLSGSSIAAAAALHGWVVSLSACDEYLPETIVVSFRFAEEQEHPVVLPHLIEPAHLLQVQRKYESNPKHKRYASHNSGVRISSMDLKDEVAQQVLDLAITMAGEERLFAMYEGTIYVFFEHTERHYHGYRVDDPYEYQHRDTKIFNGLCRCGWVRR